MPAESYYSSYAFDDSDDDDDDDDDDDEVRQEGGGSRGSKNKIKRRTKLKKKTKNTKKTKKTKRTKKRPGIYDDRSVKELQNLAKSHSLTGYSKLTRSQLIAKLRRKNIR
jgi:hypothetical protein